MINNLLIIFVHPKLFSISSASYNTNLLACEDGPCYSDGCILTLRQAKTLRRTSVILLSSARTLCYGNSNGLLLVGYHKVFWLLNPSISKTLLIPPCPLPHYFLQGVRYVLGFVPESKDYKVIAIARTALAEMRVAVYTLSAKQWTVRNDGLNVDGLSFKRIFGVYNIPSNGFYFDGVAYWIANNPYEATDTNANHGDERTHLVSFDFDLEIFSFLEMPYTSDESGTLGSLFILEESLVVFGISEVSARIWVLEQDSGKRSWTLWFSEISSRDAFDMFKAYKFTKVIYYDGCIIFGNKSYNIATCEVRKLNNSLSPCFDLEIYTKSSVLCRGYGAVEFKSNIYG